jgi:endonuclease/exonuclease/phosphatase family metal-dependent hydrolase
VGVTDLRVASFNIRNGRALDALVRSWPFRRRAVVAAIASIDADVTALQEVYRFQLRGLLRGLPGRVAVGEGRSARRHGEHVPLLVAEGRARVVESATRWYGAAPDRPGSRWPGASFPRIATIVVLDVAGTRVQVVSTHLDERSSDLRTRSARQLAEWLDPALPRVVLGDLNAEPAAPELAPLLHAGLRQALPSDAGGTSHDFTGRTDGRRLDHVLVSDDVEVVAAEVLHPRPGGRLPSDHWPVVASLRL